MPRAFSPQEKESIRRSLITAVLEQTAQGGLRSVSIDSLVTRAHISKGAFYLFYTSKEWSVLDAVRFVQDAARRDFAEIANSDNSVRLPRRLLEELFAVFSRYPLLREISDSNNLVELFRALPASLADEEFQSDEAFFRSVFEPLVAAKKVRDLSLDVLCGLPRLVLAMELQKPLIGNDRYDALKTLLIAGLSKELEP
jgi:AcrR family transcriptional regulator